MQGRIRRRNRLNDRIRGGRGVARLFSIALDGAGSRLAGGNFVVRQNARGLLQRAAEEVGAEWAGFDNGNANAKRGQFGGERLGKALDGKLGGIVDTPAGHAGEAANGRKINDVAAALVSQVWQDGAGNPKEAKNICVVNTGDLSFAGLFDRAGDSVAGVIDQDIDTTETGHGALHNGGNLRRFAQVHRGSQQTVRRSRKSRGHRLRVSRSRDDGIAALQSGTHKFAAKTLRSAGDEPDSTIRLACHWGPLPISAENGAMLARALRRRQLAEPMMPPPPLHISCRCSLQGTFGNKLLQSLNPHEPRSFYDGRGGGRVNGRRRQDGGHRKPGSIVWDSGRESSRGGIVLSRRRR